MVRLRGPDDVDDAPVQSFYTPDVTLKYLEAVRFIWTTFNVLPDAATLSDDDDDDQDVANYLHALPQGPCVPSSPCTRLGRTREF